MWKFNEEFNCWSLTKTSGFLTLTFDLFVPNEEKNRIYRLSVRGLESVYRELFANGFRDAMLQANELVYDALRWNN